MINIISKLKDRQVSVTQNTGASKLKDRQLASNNTASQIAQVREQRKYKKEQRSFENYMKEYKSLSQEEKNKYVVDYSDIISQALGFTAEKKDIMKTVSAYEVIYKYGGSRRKGVFRTEKEAQQFANRNRTGRGHWLVKPTTMTIDVGDEYKVDLGEYTAEYNAKGDLLSIEKDKQNYNKWVQGRWIDEVSSYSPVKLLFENNELKTAIKYGVSKGYRRDYTSDPTKYRYDVFDDITVNYKNGNVVSIVDKDMGLVGSKGGMSDVNKWDDSKSSSYKSYGWTDWKPYTAKELSFADNGLILKKDIYGVGATSTSTDYGQAEYIKKSGKNAGQIGTYTMQKGFEKQYGTYLGQSLDYAKNKANTLLAPRTKININRQSKSEYWSAKERRKQRASDKASGKNRYAWGLGVPEGKSVAGSGTFNNPYKLVSSTTSHLKVKASNIFTI